jgi:polyphosphate kinase 2 (PPK2 family)
MNKAQLQGIKLMVQNYENELRDLQVELVKLQKWVQKHKKRVLIILEGRDTAGKGNDKQKARRESIPHVLAQINYTGKVTKGVSFHCDPNTLTVYSPATEAR